MIRRPVQTLQRRHKLNNNAMSLQKNSDSNQKSEKRMNPNDLREGQKQLQSSSEQFKQIIHNTKIARIHELVQDKVSADKPKVLYTFTFPADPSCRAKHLVFKNVKYILSNWLEDQFPNVIYIQASGVNGYFSNNKATNKVAALELESINVDESQGLRTYQLTYALNDVVVWKVPLAAQTIDFGISLDKEQVAENLPLPNPLTLNFEVRMEK